MFFIVLNKWKQSPAQRKDFVEQYTKTLQELEKQGIKMKVYWTLGHYDGVSIVEAPSEKEVMKMIIPLHDIVDSETMVAIPREEAIKLL